MRHTISYNQIIKDVLIKDIPKEKIDVLGNMRMDEIFKNRKTIEMNYLFFYFQ